MTIFDRRHRYGKQFQNKLKFHKTGARLAAFFLCLAILTCLFPAPAAAADTEEKLSDIVDFDSITLHYTDSDGRPEGTAIENGALIKQDAQLILRYTYKITEDQCKNISANTLYYLNVSPHLSPPDLSSGSPLTIESEDGTKEQFGTIYANGSKAWVTFLTIPGSTETVLSKYGELNDAYFYLNCKRADTVPPGEYPLDGHTNLYAMKFEDVGQLNFGYAENEPVTAKARIDKDGILRDRTITWTVNYTPWQNPGENDGVTLDTPFELRDTIDTSLHSYVDGSIKINDSPVTTYASRETIPDDAAAYAIAETSDAGDNITLTLGGTKFKAGQATEAKPAESLEITYQTSINDCFILPGGNDGSKITNAAELFAGKDGVFNTLNIKSQKTVPIPQPTWITKTGKTTRHTDGTGSTTDWTVTFHPNRFSFDDKSKLTLHDQLPDGSTLAPGPVQVNGSPVTPTTGKNNSFIISPITADGQPVTITYQTHVSEDMYDNSTSLGSNVAWFTFLHDGNEYTTPKAATPVGSGDGTGTPDTAALVKTNTGYNAATRTIAWTVTINPHKAYLKGGTFTDNLKLGSICGVAGHTNGLELAGDVTNMDVKVNGNDPTAAEKALINLEYSRQQLVMKVGEIGPKTISVTYTTKVCDPCIFANNTETTFKNTISTTDMIIGSLSTTKRSASADSTADVCATVLTKKPPVYDYATGIMTWTVEVDAAGLPMANVILTDNLPAGLHYIENSLVTAPVIPDASASVAGQTLTIHLGTVSAKTTVTFGTKIDPETLGFGKDRPVVVENTIYMNGNADGVTFTQVSHSIKQNFSNHGLVKSSNVDNRNELIRYEVLINPFGLALPEQPSLVDTLDKRLQLDTDTLLFYRATPTGTSENEAQKPGYTKDGTGQPLNITGFDPETNSFTVQLPISAGSRETYVLAYTADVIQRQADGYSNSVRFDGGSVMLGGSKNNTAVVSGGSGGGGGGGVASRKASISIIKTDSETNIPLPGISFTLYQWNSVSNTRGLPFALGTTDAQGRLSFKVKPETSYELVETKSIPGYGSIFGWTTLPDGITETADGLLIKAGTAKSELTLKLTNDARTTDIAFRLVNASGIPMAGTKVQLFTSDPTNQTNPIPFKTATVLADGTIKIPGIRRGATYYIRPVGGDVITVTVPADIYTEATITLADGTTATLTADYQVTGTVAGDQQWTLTVTKIISGSTTPLAGASIGLYADADCRTMIKTEVSSPDGTVSFNGLIKGQTYWLKETAAPSGYRLSSRIYESSEDTSNVTIDNEPKTSPSHPTDPGGTTPGNSDAPGAQIRPAIQIHPIAEVENIAPDPPQTGDRTPPSAVVAFISGIILLGITIYQLPRSKKRRKRQPPHDSPTAP